MSDGPESGMTSTHRTPTAVEAARRRRALRPVVPLLIALVVGSVIAYREVPWVQRQAQHLLNPAQARAVEACEVAALKLASAPDFARIVTPGRVHVTQRGFYVERIVLGQMAQQGGEQRSFVDCYADLDGNVVNVGVPARRGSTPPAEKR
jgi:hypothetical protein